MQRVFIDLGAHGGSTAHCVFEGGFAFDRVISVEPDPVMVAVLKKRFAKQLASGALEIAPIGVADRNGSMVLYGDNAGGGASLVASKTARDDRDGVEVPILDWPSFLKRFDLLNADLYVKINVEGGEVMIVDSMVAQGGAQIKGMVIDFDIIKSPFGGWRKWRAVRRLKRAGVPFELSEKVFVKGSKRSGIENWLAALPELRHPPAPRDPLNLHQYLRVKYLEAVSALGLRHDMFKLKRKKPAKPAQDAAPLRPVPAADILLAQGPKEQAAPAAAAAEPSPRPSADG